MITRMRLEASGNKIADIQREFDAVEDLLRNEGFIIDGRSVITDENYHRATDHTGTKYNGRRIVALPFKVGEFTINQAE